MDSMSVSEEGSRLRSSSDRQYTRFERARILGARALQISLGAPVLLDLSPTLIDPVELAEKEFEAGVVPIIVYRPTLTPSAK